jgi:hypothetical protein
MTERDWLILTVKAAWDEYRGARAENHAVHAELARLRELLDLATGMIAQSWQEADVLKKRVTELEAPVPKPTLGRKPTIEVGVMYRLLLKRIREYGRDPSRADLSFVIQETAAELGVTPRRVHQIIAEDMPKGWTWTPKKK